MTTYLEKMFIIEGIIFAIIGLLFFIFPLQSIISLSTLIAVLFIIVGVLTIFVVGLAKENGFISLMVSLIFYLDWYYGYIPFQP